MTSAPARVGILTSGGDAPGMNAAIYQLWCSCHAHGMQVVGVGGGYRGILDGDLRALGERELLLAQRMPGTLLGTSRLPQLVERAGDLVRACARHRLDALVVLGGRGSIRAAALLGDHGLAVVALPATIDNDVAGSDETIGFDSALAAGIAAVDGLRATAESMPRVFAIETLGGDTGHLACAVAAAGFADLVLVPERPLPVDAVEAPLRDALARRGYAVAVGGEGYPALRATLATCVERVGSELRYTKLGHAQRGAPVSAHDRLLARSLAREAAAALAEGAVGAVVARGGRPLRVPFGAVIGEPPEPCATAGLEPVPAHTRGGG
jgi:6-phosphofructokinase 1